MSFVLVNLWIVFADFLFVPYIVPLFQQLSFLNLNEYLQQLSLLHLVLYVFFLLFLLYPFLIFLIESLWHLIQYLLLVWHHLRSANYVIFFLWKLFDNAKQKFFTYLFDLNLFLCLPFAVGEGPAFDFVGAKFCVFDMCLLYIGGLWELLLTK